MSAPADITDGGPTENYGKIGRFRQSFAKPVNESQQIAARPIKQIAGPQIVSDDLTQILSSSPTRSGRLAQASPTGWVGKSSK
jgi:hypothetical protein